MDLQKLQALVAEQQSPSNLDYFTLRATRCFSHATGSSWLDCWMSGHLPTSVEQQSLPIRENGKELTPASSRTISSFILPIKVETETELQKLIDSHPEGALKIFFIRQRNSASRLNITWHLFDALCHKCHISNKLRDYVMCFGLRSGESEIVPPTLHYHCEYSKSLDRAVSLECMYVLRFVEINNRQHGNPWSIRQSAVYSRYDFRSSLSTWLFIAASHTTEARLQDLQTESAALSAFQLFEIHYVLFDIAVGSWRRYIVYIAEEIRQQADRAIVADLETDGGNLTRLEERQYLKQIEDNVTDLISTLNFMVKNIDLLIKCHSAFQHQRQLSRTMNLEARTRIRIISRGFEDRRRDLLHFSSQALALKHKVDSASNLVSSILDLNNGNALKALALETQAENANMALLTRKSVQDAAMVKVLTIVTLVYLPVTVVTNFFSTQFVNVLEQSDGSFSLNIASSVWILFAASVPLTIFTVYIWWVFAQKEISGTFPKVWAYSVQVIKHAWNKTQQSDDREMLDRS